MGIVAKCYLERPPFKANDNHKLISGNLEEEKIRDLFTIHLVVVVLFLKLLLLSLPKGAMEKLQN